jgi:hypothetical protein
MDKFLWIDSSTVANGGDQGLSLENIPVVTYPADLDFTSICHQNDQDMTIGHDHVNLLAPELASEVHFKPG